MLHRPYIRKSVRMEVESRAQKNEKGQFLDANTNKPVDGKYDLGHKYGHEFWREAEKAQKEGLTQKQFNDRMNNPDFYQIENFHENRSHAYEMPRPQKDNSVKAVRHDKGGKSTVGENDFINRIRVDKATLERINEVHRNNAKNINQQPQKKSSAEDGGRERGDTGPMGHGRESGYKGGSTPTAHNTSGKGLAANGQASQGGHGTAAPGGHGGHGTAGSGGQGGHGGQGGGGHGGTGGGGGHGGQGGSGGQGGH